MPKIAPFCGLLLLTLPLFARSQVSVALPPARAASPDTAVEITRPPGQRTLQIVLGDTLHVPHVPPLRSEKLPLTVAQ